MSRLIGGLVLVMGMIGWLDALAGSAFAQSEFLLSAPGLDRSSRAVLGERELRVVDHQGRETVYVREPRLDSADGAYWAYRNAAARQIIRWPASNRGPMQIGNESAAGIEYRTSQMQVSAVGGTGNTNRPVLPPNVRPGLPGNPLDNLAQPGLRNDRPGLDPRQNARAELFSQILSRSRQRGLRANEPIDSLQPQVMQLVVRDDRGRDWFLGKAGPDRVMMHSVAEPTAANWTIVPAGSGFVRIQQQIGAGWYGLAVSSRRTLLFEPIAQVAQQLWRVAPANYADSGYWLESCVAPGYVLSGAVSGVVSLMPISGSFDQVWYPVLPVLPPTYEPTWRTVNHEVRPNPPLPPAEIELVNSHTNALRILVGDRRTPNVRQLRIEPGARVKTTFDRDAGATVVDTYEIRSASGLWDRQQYVTQIPAEPIYDLSVYEEFLQSIAIDRTGTSPNVIEDVNYQPKSVGLLPLPAGAALPQRGTIDAFADARAAGNPGAVRRFDPKSLEKPSGQPDPLEQILKDAAPPRQKF